jgi:type VI secretion system protein ImpL
VTKRQYADDKRGINLAAVSGVNTENVFKRRSGRNWRAVPALYTPRVRRGYRQTSSGPGQAALEERWVWGEGNAALSDPLRISAEVIALYEQDYIRAWDETLDDISVVSFPTVQQTAQALRTLASATSPLRGLLDTVKQHTRLVEVPKAGAPSVLDKARQIGESVAAAAKKAIGASARRLGCCHVYFQPIHELVTGDRASSRRRILAVIRDIGAAQHARSDVGASKRQNPADRRCVLALQLHVIPFRQGGCPRVWRQTMVEDIVITDAAPDQNNYEQQVLSDCRLVASRYPFAAGAPDIPVADFVRVFGTDGTFHKFFTQHLAKQVDTSGRAWTMHPGAATLSRPLLDLFAHAEMIREMFFGAGGQGPVLNFWVTIGNGIRRPPFHP